MKVSAIVPVYNPGSNIDDCITSLLNQSLPSHEYEVVFVDDGSTDETPARLDDLAAQHPNVRVAHIPNSGWPGRPRNVGIEMAHGRFVYFIDNDDWIGHEALERLHDTAVRDEADVVIGKVVGHGRRTSRPLFRKNRSGLGIDTPLLLGMLTPHKLFRREFLAQHDIRFPEGRVRLEDHLFVVHAYLHTQRVSILADYPCYHWVLRDANASSGRLEPVGYYQNLRDVLDLVDEHIEPGPLRDRLYAHWYRTKLLGRVGGATFLRLDPAYRDELYGEIRRLALERFGEGAERRLSFPLRVRASLLRADRLDALEHLAQFEGRMRAQLGLVQARMGADGVELTLQARLVSSGAPLRFARHGDRLMLKLPGELGSALPAERLNATKPLTRSKVDIVLHSADARGEFLVSGSAILELEGARAQVDTEDVIEPVLAAHAVINPRTAAAGRPLDVGDWRLQARVTMAGFQAEQPIRLPGSDVPILLRVAPGGGVRMVGRRRDVLRRLLRRSSVRAHRAVRRATSR